MKVVMKLSTFNIPDRPSKAERFSAGCPSKMNSYLNNSCISIELNLLFSCSNADYLFISLKNCSHLHLSIFATQSPAIGFCFWCHSSSLTASCQSSLPCSASASAVCVTSVPVPIPSQKSHTSASISKLGLNKISCGLFAYWEDISAMSFWITANACFCCNIV